MKRLILAVVLGTAALVASALPTVEEVQAEVAKGNIAQAEQMMRGVVEARPGSARAHYVYAEILARGRHYEQAAEQAARAKAIDPGLQFTQPEQFKAFEQLLERERAAAARRPGGSGSRSDVVAPAAVQQQPVAAAPASGGVPGWVWGLGLAALALLAWRGLRGRSQAPMAGGAAAMAPGTASGAAAAGFPAAGAPMGGGGYGTPYPPAAAPGGRNWLGTGLAAAGGVAAGMMAERMLHGDHAAGSQGLAGPSTDAPGLRGMAPGLLGGDAPADGDIERELDQRPIDFGAGDDWGGDAGAGDGGGSAGSSDDGW